VYVRNVVDELEEIANNDDTIERSSDENSESLRSRIISVNFIIS